MENFLDKYFGRLGNRMFQMAALYAHSKDLGVDYYFQDPKYFEKYAKEIKHLFGEKIGTDPRVSIHVRRAKNPSNPEEPAYSENDFYINLMDTDYYQKAMAKIPNRQFLVFSDDIEWCKKQEIFKDCDFSEGKDEIEDFRLMASCIDHIIANSSYSWWAAFLGKGQVIAPSVENWYADGIERTKCPLEWIRI